MKKEKAIEHIAVSLLSNSIDNQIRSLEDCTKLFQSVKYHNKTFNDSYRSHFNEYREILQGLVDSFYFGYYEVKGWKNLTSENYEEVVNENLITLKSMKRLLKFIS